MARLQKIFWILGLIVMSAAPLGLASDSTEPAPVSETPSIDKSTAPKDWLDLSSSWEPWQAPLADWQTAREVQLHPEQAKWLQYTAGQGIIVNGPKGNTRNLVTKSAWGDVELQLEFFLAKGSNSGIKFHEVYEIQLHDSAAVPAAKLDGTHCGGIYPRAELTPKYHHLDKGIAPRVNAAKPAGTWQSLQIIFRAPRFDAAGQKITPATLEKVVLNGQVIHENQIVQTPTGHNWHKPEHARGKLLLQADHGPVAFRQIRLRPLD